MDATSLTTAVHGKYSAIALASSKPTSKPSCCTPKPSVNSKPSSCSAPNATAQATNGDEASDYATRVARSFGYDASALSSLPPSTNLGLSCGNPLATQNLGAHEVVIDLGSGGGLDVILAAKQLIKSAEKGTKDNKLTGKVYGIDSSEAMIQLARRNTQSAKLSERETVNGEGRDGTDLVEYVHAPITKIPLRSEVADLVISNCVINLVPHEQKHTVFTEIHRLLKAGGRLAVSDVLTKKPLPEAMRNNVALVVGCVSGAASVEEYKKWLMEAGFEESGIVFRESGSDLNAYKLTQEERKAMGGDDSVGCCGVAVAKETDAAEDAAESNRDDEKLFDESVRDIDFNEWVGSYEIYAVKA